MLALNLGDEDVNAIFVAGSALLAHEAESKQDAVSGFLLGEGEVAGVSCELCCSFPSLLRCLMGM